MWSQGIWLSSQGVYRGSGFGIPQVTMIDVKIENGDVIMKTYAYLSILTQTIVYLSGGIKSSEKQVLISSHAIFDAIPSPLAKVSRTV